MEQLSQLAVYLVIRSTCCCAHSTAITVMCYWS